MSSSKRVVVAFLLFIAFRGYAAEQACTPLTFTASPQGARVRPLAAIYWDVSKSVDKRFDNHVKALVSTLDSRVLPLAGAAAPIRHYSVGATVSESSSGEIALKRDQESSALHEASRMIGADLARNLIGAAILVTDLEVDRPALPPDATAVCGDVPVSTVSNAGPLFGRCFSAGWRLAPAVRGGTRPPGAIDHLLLVVFRSRYAAPLKDGVSRRHLYVIVAATDLDFGRRIESGLRQRLATDAISGYESFTIVDTSALPRITTAWERGDGRSVRPAKGYGSTCAFACYEEEAHVDLRLHIAPAVTNAWVRPDGKPRIITTADSPQVALRPQGRWDVIWPVKCINPANRLQPRKVGLQFGWSVPPSIPSNANIDHANVEDALISLVQAVVPLLSPRTFTVEIGLR